MFQITSISYWFNIFKSKLYFYSKKLKKERSDKDLKKQKTVMIVFLSLLNKLKIEKKNTKFVCFFFLKHVIYITKN